MKLIDNILYLSTLDLEGFEVSKDSVKSRLLENRNRHGVGSWSHIKDPNDSRKVLVQFETIPDQTKKSIEKVICRQKGLKSIDNLKNYLTDIAEEQANCEGIDQLTRLINKTYREEDKEYFISKKVNTQKAIELSKCAALLTLLALIKTKAQVQSLGIEGIELKSQLYKLAIKWLLKNKVKSLPTHPDRFSRKVNEFSKMLNKRTDALLKIGGKSISLRGNTNNQKLNDAVQKYILNLWLFYDDVNPKPGSIKLLPHDIHQVYEQNRLSRKFALNKESGEVVELPEISLSSVKNVIYRNPIIAAARHGNKYLNDKFRPIVQGIAPKYALSMWSMDDMDSSFPMRHKGKELRPKLYFVFDVATGYIPGWEMGAVYKAKNDTPMKTLINKATSKTIFNSGYKLPLEWQMEKYATAEFKAKLESNFEQLKTSDYQQHEQSKFAEKYIDRFQNEVERKISGWKGQGIRTRKEDSQPNREIATKTFTHEELIKLYSKLVEEWNNNPVSQKDSTPRAQAFAERQNKEAVTISERKYSHIFGRHTFQTIGTHKTSQRGFVEPIFNGIEYSYEVPNHWELMGKISNQGRVRLTQNPFDTDKCWLWEYDSKDEDNLHKDIFLCECISTTKVQRSKAESGIEDNEALGHHLKRKDQFDDFIGEQLEEVKQWNDYDVLEEDAEFVFNSPYDKQKHDKARQSLESKRIDIYGADASEDEVLPD